MAGPYNLGAALNYLGIGKQSALATDVIPTVFIPYLGDATIDHGQEGEDIREGGSGPFIPRAVKTKHGIGGGFSTPWRPSTCGKLLAWFLGNDTAGTPGDTTTHTSTPVETATLLSIEHNQSDEIVERVADCVLSKMTITSPHANGELMCAVEWAGTVPTYGDTPTAETYETGLHGTSPGAPYRSSDGTFTIAGVAATNVESWELVLDWGIDTDIYLSQVTRNRILKLQFSAELKIRTLELDDDDYRSVNYGSTSGTTADGNYRRETGGDAFVAVYNNGLATTDERELSITIPELVWKGAPRKLQAAGATSILERTATVVKGASDILTVVSTTADTSAY